ncbi:MAG: hypothetical protein M3N33_07720 [Actinomycetota bacterium]|nr:hypothetical protein [Actinomycetota bacterium]
MLTFAARHSADYDTNVDLDNAEVGGWLEEGRAFLNAARDYLDVKGAEEDHSTDEQA